MKAPTIPTTSPRIIFDPLTDFQPSSRDFNIPISAVRFDAAPFGISCRLKIVKAAKAKLAAFTYSAKSTAVPLKPGIIAMKALVKSESKVNSTAAIGAVPYAAKSET